MGYVRLIKDCTFSIGKLNKLEGEIMDLLVYRPEHYNVGDHVNCLCPKISFQSNILKKKDECISLYAPFSLGNFITDRRALPRIETNINALLNDNMSEKVYDFAPSTEIVILNVSMKGFGFISTKKLNGNVPYYLHLDVMDQLEEPDKIIIKVKIKNDQIHDDGYRYGCEIEYMKAEDLSKFKGFMLKQQLTCQQ